MELRYLTAFCEVAKERSFTRAAGNLHCAQSTITGYVKHLEHALSTELIRRGGRQPVELTEAGALFLVRARQVLQVMETADREIRGVVEGSPAGGAAAPASVVAFFDIDETLIRGRSMPDFVAHCRRLGLRISARGVPEGCTPSELARAGRSWVEAELAQERFFHEPVRQALRRHKEDGHHVVLVTGAFEACARSIAEAVAADDVLTGDSTAPAAGRDQAERARAVMRRYGARPVDCYAYGNHAGDLPLLQSVGHPVLVGDDPELDVWARQGGWLRLPGVETSRASRI
ncbi:MULTISPECIES: haloacid dehalogenase-like hydrolase [Streptomyces]|uniref:haloacid dehalogenase-like hydrolase n=1 Tax=Streptomyces TaxID=1883 RepID=UPI001675BD7D|nr:MULTISPECIES: haloacid dehalogenase-like hydrolase [Streptomyces]MBK3527813.1 haloacid dehalogenase-like hydrolase [Streptomyces sp. MBT70]GGR95480.1 hypothetical protein GCM10010236_57540 [Streptomyces eurythermus]